MDESINKRLSNLGVTDPIQDSRSGKISDIVDDKKNQLSIIMKNVDIINEDNIKIGYIHEFKVVEILGGCKWETIAVTGSELLDIDTNRMELRGNGMWLGYIYKFESREDALGNHIHVVLIRRYFIKPTKEEEIALMRTAGDIDRKDAEYRRMKLKNNG